MPRDKMNYSERGRIGGHATQAKRTPEQRREMGLNSYLAAAVATIEKNFDKLTPEQRERVIKALDAADAAAGDL